MTARLVKYGQTLRLLLSYILAMQLADVTDPAIVIDASIEQARIKFIYLRHQ